MKNFKFFNVTTEFVTNSNFTKIHTVDTSGSCLLLTFLSLTSLWINKKRFHLWRYSVPLNKSSLPGIQWQRFWSVKLAYLLLEISCISNFELVKRKKYFILYSFKGVKNFVIMRSFVQQILARKEEDIKLADAAKRKSSNKFFIHTFNVNIIQDLNINIIQFNTNS